MQDKILGFFSLKVVQGQNFGFLSYDSMSLCVKERSETSYALAYYLLRKRENTYIEYICTL